MPAMTGEISADFDGKTYRLRLTHRKIATLQAEFGLDFMKPLQEAEKAERLPPMDLCLRIVELSLGKAAEDFDGDLADELLTADIGILGRLLTATFPSDEGAADAAPPADAAEDDAGKKQKAAGA